MDINDNQQINNFVKGMNTDVSDALMDSSQYRYAENVRLVTNNESNSGELRLIPGANEMVYGDLPWNKNQETNLSIIAMTSIRDILVVVTSNSNIYAYNLPDKPGWTHIYGAKVWEAEDFADIPANERAARVNEANANELFGLHLSIVTRWETDKLIKLYMADGKHRVMYINLMDPKIKLDPETFYYGIDNLCANIEKMIDPIQAKVSEAIGNIPPAKVQYTCRFYKVGGAATSLSPMSNVVSLYKSINEGYEYDEAHTNKAVDLTIPDKPIGSINTIQIFRIAYRLIGQQPEVSLIYDGVIPESGTFTDTGYDIESMSLADLLSMIKTPITTKVIESKNDYLFAANIKYNDSEFEDYLELNGITEAAKAPSTGCTNNDGYNILFSSANILNYDVNNWKSPIDNTLGGEGDYVKWEYCTERFYTTVDNKKMHHSSDSGNTLNSINELCASLRHGEAYRYGMILYNARGQKSSVKWIADIMIPNMSSTLLHPESQSTDLPYRWMNDITLNPDADANIIKYRLTRVGIKFTIKSSFWTKFSDVVAVEIVRAERTSADRICITQGVIGFPYRVWKRENDDAVTYEKETSYLCHPGFLSMNNITASSEETDDTDRHRTKGVTNIHYLIFASPEVCYQTDDVKALLDNKRNNIFICPAYRNIYQSMPIVTHATYEHLLTGNSISHWSNTSGIMIQGIPYGLNYAPCFEQDSSVSPNGLKFTRIMGRELVLYRFVPENHEESEYIDPTQYDIHKVSVYKNLSTFHCAPYTSKFTSEHNPVLISKFAAVEPENSDSFFIGDENKIPTIDKALTMLDGDLFMHWTNPMLIEYDHIWGDMQNEDSFIHDDGNRYPIFYPMGSVGRSLIMRLDETDNNFATSLKADALSSSCVTFQTADIKTKVVPYGGAATITTGNYLSFGNVIKRKRNQGLFDMWNDSSMEVYDGDCYPGIFNYCAAHAWYEPNMCCGVRMASFYSIPIESDIDLSATYGDLYTSPNSGYRYYLQDKKTVISNIFTLSKDMYEYNTAYGAMPTAIEYSAVSYSAIDTNKYDTRVHYSDLKTNGEHIDNWLMFRPNNFLDVDSRFGEITNMRLFKDKLLYWQEHAVGVLSSNERTVLNDIDHNQIILGTGDVLQRYDYISTIHGMKPDQFEAEIQSNTTQYWWDSTNKELLAYAGGMETVPLAKIKNCLNYINSYPEVSHPSLSYDVRCNELMASVVNNGTLVYNENVQQFTSVYTFNPVFRAVRSNKLYLTSTDNIYMWDTQASAAVAKLFDSSGLIDAKPRVQYVVNKANAYNKVFDIVTFGGRFYGGDNSDLDNLTFKFDTPLKQHSQCTGSDFITNREYDFRLAIPRNNDDFYGGRMRGKTMQCELSSSSNSTDFSLQYIVTKYRMSWS